MRILGICNLFPPYIMGGNEIRFRGILERLRQHHDVMALTSIFGGYREKEDWISRSLILAVPYPMPLPSCNSLIEKLSRLGVVWRTVAHNYRVTRELMTAFKPDIAFMSDTKRMTLASARAVTEFGVPLVWDITDLSLRMYTRPSLLLKAISIRGLSFEHAVPISSYIKQELVAAGILGETAVPINQGVDLSLFSPDAGNRPERCPRALLFVGGLIPDKGCHVVLRALRGLVNLSPDYTLTVCGDSKNVDYKADLHAFVKEHNLEGNVEFLGRLDNQALPDIYRRHDVFVFSSIWDEPFATTPLEAMACGIPVVGAMVGGQGDLFRDGENCLTYDKLSEESLMMAIRRLDESPLREKLVKTALLEVRARYSFTDYVEKLERVLLEATQSVPR